MEVPSVDRVDHRACSSRKPANITRTIFGSSSPRCASVNAATLWTMGAPARKMRRSSWSSSTGPACEPGGLEQLAHAGGDDAVKLAGVGGHVTLRRLGQERAGWVGRATVAVAIRLHLRRGHRLIGQALGRAPRGRGRLYFNKFPNRFLQHQGSDLGRVGHHTFRRSYPHALQLARWGLITPPQPGQRRRTIGRPSSPIVTVDGRDEGNSAYDDPAFFRSKRPSWAIQ
jgi:hypothetical protein